VAANRTVAPRKIGLTWSMRHGSHELRWRGVEKWRLRVII
jgi:hypothetical protein